MLLVKYIARSLGSISILKKLLIGLLTVVIPLFALSFYINNIGMNKNREGISNLLINSLDSYNRLMETEFQRIVKMQERTTVEMALQQVELQSGDFSHTDEMIMIMNSKKLMTDLRNTSWLIANVRAYFTTLDYMIDNTSSRTGIMEEQEFQALLKEDGASLLYDLNDKLFITSPYINNKEDLEKSDGLLLTAVQISKQSLKTLLNKITNYKSGGTVLMSSDLSWYVSNRIEPEIIAYMPEIIEQSEQTGFAAKNSAQISYIDINGKSNIAAFRYSTVLDTMLVTYAQTDEVFVLLRIYWIFFWIMSILSVVIIGVFSLWIYKIIHKPLKTLVNSFKRVEKGDLGFSVDYIKKDEFGYLYGSFNYMLDRLNYMIYEVYEQRIRSQHSELKRLQSQINPHFLYNSFFVLSRLIHSGDTNAASQFSTYLGQYFRFITRDSADEINLESEVSHAKTYTDIQKVCYADRISVTLEELPASLYKVKVPRLILQPVIENSYKYAFENKLNDAQLMIRFTESWENGELYSVTIIIEDNGDDMSDEKLDALKRMLISTDSNVDEYTGLYNVHRRIYLEYGEGSGLRLERSQMGGLKVEMIFILKNKRKDVNDE